MSYPLARIAVLALALHAAAGARADNHEPSMFSFRGFGTLGIVHSNEDRSDFTSTPSKPNGAGYSRAWSAEVDSLIAAQVTARFTPKISAVVQVVSEQNHDGSYRPHLEWANIRFQVTPEFFIRAGRTVLPVLMVTDSRKVGFANPWVRPPVEVYALVPVTSNDGVDATYRMTLATATNTLQLTAGRTDTKYPGATSQVRELAVLVDTFEQGPLTARIVYGRARVTLASLDPLLDGFRQFGPEGVAIAEKYSLHDRLVNFYGVGASYDPGPGFLMAEWVGIKGDSILGRKSAWYVSGGYRFGKITPYLTYARANSDNLSDPGLTVTALPPAFAGPAMGLNAALNSALSGKVVQNTVSVGARWDVRRDVAFKVQLDHTRIGAGSTGEFRNIQPGLQPGGRVNVISAVVDFTF